MSAPRRLAYSKPLPFAPGDRVEVTIAKGLDPIGGVALAEIELNVSAQFGRGMFRVIFENGKRDVVHERRLTRAE